MFIRTMGYPVPKVKDIIAFYKPYHGIVFYQYGTFIWLFDPTLCI